MAPANDIKQVLTRTLANQRWVLSYKKVMVNSSEISFWSKEKMRCTNSLNNCHYIKAYLTSVLLLRVNRVFPVTSHVTVSSNMRSARSVQDL